MSFAQNSDDRRHAQVGRTAWGTLTSCLLGIMVSLYALHVEKVGERQPDYAAYCDISEKISCTAVLTTRFGRGFGLLGLVLGDDSLFNLPNSLFGIAFYILQVLLELKSTRATTKVQVIASIIANLGSVYLAAILYFVVHSFCLICVSIYVINAVLLICNLRKWKTFAGDRTKSRKKTK